MSRKKKNYRTDKFYFEVNNIAIYRDEESMARQAFETYTKNGKSASWLGKWNGKKFEKPVVAKK